MAPSLRDLQLTTLGRRSEPSIAARDETDDLEDVGLLDSYDKRGGDEIDWGLRRIQLKVTGMTCAACSNSVESAVAGVDGVVRVSVALLQNKADVVFDPKRAKV